jgi:hypothetical protein
MKYLKEPITGRIVSGEAFGAFFDDWQELTQSEIDTYKLANARAKKITEIKGTRDNTPLNFTPTGTTKNFILKISDLPQIAARASRLQDQGAGSKSTWSDVDGVRQELVTGQFRSMRNHLDAHDETLRIWYAEVKQEIEDCTTLEELNNININFS